MANKKFDSVRDDVMARVKELLAKDNDVLRTNSNELCIPIVAEDGDEGYLVLTFKVPTGSRDGDVYDGYSMAEDYAIKQKNKAEEAEKRAKEKERKIARDKAQREAKAKAKAEAKAREEVKGQ